MYANFFSFDRYPFEDRIDDAFTLLTSRLEETLATLLCQVQYRKRGAIVVGDAGVGKSQLVARLVRSAGDSARVAHLVWQPATMSDLVREVAIAVGVTPAAEAQQQRTVERLSRALEKTTQNNAHTLLIIDQVEQLTSRQITALRAFVDLSADGSPLMTVVLVGQPALEATLRDPAHAGLFQKLAPVRKLRAFTQDETAAYIRHRLQIAGGSPDLFEDAAIDLLHRAAGGNPRIINQIAHEALLAAYGDDSKEISARLLRDVLAERGDFIEHAPAGEVSERTFAPSASSGTNPGVDHQTTTSDAAFDEPSAAFVNPDGADALARRLEYAAARAERSAETSEAMLAQTRAVEKHLESLTVSAERLIDILGTHAKRAADTVDSMGTKAQSIIRRIETAAENATRSADDANETEERMQDRIAAAQAAADKCEQREMHLAQVAEKIADRASDVHAQLEALARQQSDAKNTESALRALITDASETAKLISTSACAKAVSDVREQIDGITADAQKRSDAISGDAQRRLDGITADAQERIDGMTTKTETRIASMSDDLAKLGARIDTARHRVGATTDEVENLERNLDAMTNRGSLLISEVGSAVDNGKKRAEQIVTELDEQAISLESNLERAKTETAALTSATQNATEIAENLTGASHRAEQQCEYLARAESVVSEARKTTEALEPVIADAALEHGRIQKLQASALAAAARIDTSLQRAESIQAKLDDANEAAAEQLGRIDARIGEVSKAVAEAGKAATHTRSTSVEAHARTRQLQEVARRAESIEQQLSGNVGKAAAAAATAGSTIEQLAALKDDAATVRAEIAAAQIAADEKLQKLASHQAGAQAVLLQLTDANTTAHDALDRCNEQTTACATFTDETVQRIDRLVHEVWALTGKTERKIADLHEAAHIATTAEVQLTGAIEPATQLHDRLTSATTRAAEDVTKIEKTAETANALAKRLAQVNELVDAAKQAEQSIQTTIDELQQTAGELTGTVEDADTQVAVLRDLNAQTLELIDRQHRAQIESGETLSAIENHIKTTRTSVDTGERLLREFVTGAEAVEKKIGKLETRSEQIEKTTSDATANQQRMLDEAKLHTDKLAKILQIVREAFGGLTKCIQGARERTDALEKVGLEAGDRLTRITATCDRATTTLNDWIAEAMQVQQKLQRTVDAAVTVSKTQDMNSLSTLSRLTAPKSRSPEAQADSKVIQSAEKPAQGIGKPSEKPAGVSAEEEPAPDKITAPTDRTAEIAQLLAEARGMK